MSTNGRFNNSEIEYGEIKKKTILFSSQSNDIPINTTEYAWNNYYDLVSDEKW